MASEFANRLAKPGRGLGGVSAPNIRPFQSKSSFPGQTAADADFGIYVHWPFCAAKCPYCDFNSYVRHGGVDEARFVAALTTELSHFATLTGRHTVRSIFFGGGTPSLLSAVGVGSLIEAVARLWPLAQDVEITLEANPSSVEVGRFRGYREAGVNRDSLGVQALRDADLKVLGRLHDVDTAVRAVAIARAVFPRVSFDLIYARPGQTVTAWEAELRQALDTAADHLSLYQLTIEDGTPFHALWRSGNLSVPDTDLAADLFEATQAMTAAAGFAAYEISNHARSGGECRHNLVYWRGGAYVGVGPGAHGRIETDDQRIATETERHPETWLEAVARAGHGLTTLTPLSAEEAGEEYLVMGLRLAEGVDLDVFAARADRPLPATQIARFEQDGLLHRPAPKRVAATPRGAQVLNRLLLELLA